MNTEVCVCVCVCVGRRCGVFLWHQAGPEAGGAPWSCGGQRQTGRGKHDRSQKTLLAPVHVLVNTHLWLLFGLFGGFVIPLCVMIDQLQACMHLHSPWANPGYSHKLVLSWKQSKHEHNSLKLKRWYGVSNIFSASSWLKGFSKSFTAYLVRRGDHWSRSSLIDCIWFKGWAIVFNEPHTAVDWNISMFMSAGVIWARMWDTRPSV